MDLYGKTEQSLIILRGASGSGKSTLAAEIKKNGMVLSTDDFFRNLVTGTYDWNPSSLPKAHYWNQVRVKMAMEKGVSPIIVDNTNLEAWEAKPYAELAEEHDYQVHILEPATSWINDPAVLAQRGTHGLSEEAIRTMLQKWKPYSVNDALRATAPVTPLSDKEKKKIEENLRAREAGTEESTTTANYTSALLRVQVTKNDGQKAAPKPLIVKSADFEQFKKQACNQLRSKYSKKTRVFTTEGKEISSIEELKPDLQLAVSDNGTDFIPVALKKTAAEKRAEKLKKAEQLALDALEGGQNISPVKGGLRHLDRLSLGITSIIPNFLFLGSGRDAHTLSELQKHSISRILNVASDIPSSTFENIVYREHLMRDEEDQLLDPHLQEAAVFIQEAKTKGERILVHCAAGKSRSVAVTIFFLMKFEGMSLEQAYSLVRDARKEINVNHGFVRQLMLLETQIFRSSTSTLTWDNIPSNCKSIPEWLEKNNVVAAKPTHMWWEVLTKQKYAIPSSKWSQLFSEMAKYFLGGEPLKVVEMRGVRFKLHVDLDVKTSQADGNRWSPSQMLDFFKQTILAVVERFFPQEDMQFVCTYCAGLVPAWQEKELQFKFGYHLIWPNIQTDEATFQNFLRSLVKEFKEKERRRELPSDFPYEEINNYNDWEEIVDLSTLENDSGFRNLFSIKSFTCKICQKKDTVKKKDKGKNRNDAHCVFCNSTGMLDTRVHKILGIFNADGSTNQLKTEELLADLSVTAVRKQLEFTSILVADPESEVPAISKANRSDAPVSTSAPDYTAVMLDLSDQVRLLKTFEPPSDWIALADHMTICLGGLKDESGVKGGDRVSLKVTSVGKDQRAMAVKVETNIICESAFPHVTIAHSKNAKPAESNDIAESCWTEIPVKDQFSISGEVKEWRKFGAPTQKEVKTVSAPEYVISPPWFETLLKAKRKNANVVLKTIEFLRKHDESTLTKTFHLKAVRHQEHLNLVQFSYGKTSCDFNEPIVQECRGLILDSKDDWNVVAFPYVKFFNYGEKVEHDVILKTGHFDWNTAVISEKVDGSIATLYCYKGKWYVASSSVPDGSSAIAKDITFAELFWSVWNAKKYTLPKNANFTYMFELFSPKNTIVVRPTRETIILHGVRDNLTYEEQPAQQVAEENGWEYVKTFQFSSIESILSAARKLDPSQNEGYVLRDANFQRWKIKSPQYVALAHLNISNSLGVNARHMLQIVKNNEGSEFLTHFPEHKILFFAVKSAYDRVVNAVEGILSEGSAISQVDRKILDLAKQAQKEGHSDVRNFFQTFEDDEVLFKLLNISDDGISKGEPSSHSKKLEKRSKKLAKRDRDSQKRRDGFAE
eukprot:TRINITY_DN2500_c0_g1_i1.p1 TRINITY_DN2500_c0_g1~~TRINITY_DN2500_c0_g1_i1.p1  ORF type:complete len:1342 (-),score=368.34 TRINITY_DN2500_c0_g1_i1:71-4096(-)